MPTKQEQAFNNDGMQHYYSTCPRCYHIVSDEQIVFVDGVKMCRTCLSSENQKRERKPKLVSGERE